MLWTRILTFMLVSLLVIGCGGGGGSDSKEDEQDNPIGGTPQTPVTVNKNVSLQMTTGSPLDRSDGEVILVDIRSVGNDGTVLQEETLAASPATNSNTSSEWALLANITLDQNGGKVVVNAQADGFTDYAASVIYETATDLEFRGELVDTLTVSVDIPAQRARARSSGDPVDQYVSFRMNRDQVTGASRLTASRLDVTEAEANEFGIDIPLDEIPADITQLNAEMKGFDSSDPDDSQYFPGEYADSDGNDLVSIAFNFVELTDQTGRNLADATTAARANRSASRNVEPVIITRQIPAGSCPSVNDLGDANLELDGLQIPVYTYNPNSGLWDLLGYGTIYDSAQVSPAAGFLDCDNVTYELSVEVDNEDFLRTWWNLDYPLVFSEPTTLCANVRLVDVNGDPISGVWVSLYDDDDRSFSTEYGYTDENGEVTFSTVLLDGSTDRTAELRFWSYQTGSYRAETVQLSEDCSSSAFDVITLQHLDLCAVEGRIVLDTDTSVGLSGTTVQFYPVNASFLDWRTTTTSDEGYFRSSVLCESEYAVFTWPAISSEGITFNVNNTVEAFESSDNGDTAVLNNVLIDNQAPYGTLLLSGSAEQSYAIGESPLSADMLAGDQVGRFTAYDWDGHFPLDYSIAISDASNQTVYSVTGTVDNWDDSEIMLDFNIPANATYSISLDLTDALGKPAEITYIYVWPDTIPIE